MMLWIGAGALLGAFCLLIALTLEGTVAEWKLDRAHRKMVNRGD